MKKKLVAHTARIVLLSILVSLISPTLPLKAAAADYNYADNMVLNDGSVSAVLTDKESITLTVGDEAVLTASVQPETATLKTVRFASNDPNVIVSAPNFDAATGKTSVSITAKANANAKIVAVSDDGGKTAVCNVKVGGDTIAPGEVLNRAKNAAEIIGSGTATVGKEVKNAFDNTLKGEWQTNAATGSLQVKLQKPYFITKYSVVSGSSASDGNYVPRDWKLYASNTGDGTDWIQLDARSSESFAANSLKRIYEFEADRAYQYFKLDITANSKGNLLEVAEFELLECGAVQKWALGPFEKMDEANPILSPNDDEKFDCPISGPNTPFADLSLYNPGAIMKDGVVHLFYRAQDKALKTSRVGHATSTDGLTFEKDPKPVLYPDNDVYKGYEWTGGTEDPRLVSDGSGTYYMYYTAYSGPNAPENPNPDPRKARLMVASSTDLVHWTKHGHAFEKSQNGKYKNEWSKSAAIVSEMIDGSPVAKKINNKYWMYWGEGDTYMATSDDLIEWTVIENADGTKKGVTGRQRGNFNNDMCEPGPAAMYTDEGIVLIYNGKNGNPDTGSGDSMILTGAYCPGQALFDKNDPTKLIDRTPTYFMNPEKDYEVHGLVGKVCFVEGLVFLNNKWFLYYGTADSHLAVAVYDPAKWAQERGTDTLSLDYYDVSLKTNEKKTVTATVKLKDGTNGAQVNFSSTNKDITISDVSFDAATGKTTMSLSSRDAAQGMIVATAGDIGSFDAVVCNVTVWEPPTIAAALKTFVAAKRAEMANTSYPIGTAMGQYSQTKYDMLVSAIDDAYELANTPELTETQATEARQTIADAETALRASQTLKDGDTVYNAYRDFANDEVGKLPFGFDIESLELDKGATAAVHEEGGKKFFRITTGTTSAKANIFLPFVGEVRNTTGQNVVVEFKTRLQGATQYANAAMLRNDDSTSGAKKYSMVAAYDNGNSKNDHNFLVQDGATKKTVLKFTDNTWYSVKMVGDWTTRTYTVYVDGVEVAKDYTFRDSATGTKLTGQLFGLDGQVNGILDMADFRVSITGEAPSELPHITAVTNPSAKTVALGTAEAAIGLPNELEVTLSDNNRMRLGVTWTSSPAYNGDLAGIYTFTGTLAAAAGITNANDVKATVTVRINAEGADDEFDAIRKKWQYLAVGGDYDPTNPDMQGLLHSINDVAADLLERINPAPTADWGTNDYLWKEYPLGKHSSPYDDSNNTQFTIRNLKFMALAYKTNGCALYQNERLKTEILRGLDYIYTSHFKPGIDTESYGNWFTWEIGGPIYLLETTLLMFDELPLGQSAAFAASALKGAAKTGGAAYMYVGANALWRDRVRMYAGILLKDGGPLDYVKNDALKYMDYVTSGDGYYTDGTFMQHGNITYNGGYGKEAFSDISHFLYMLDGTTWEIKGTARDDMSTKIEKSYVPFMYKGVFMDMVRGREITRTDTTDAYAGITISLDVLLFSETLPKAEGDRFKGMVKEWMNNENAISTLNEGAGVAWYLFPVYNLSKTLEILGDDTITPVSNAGRSYTFGKGARTVHTTDTFTFGLSMYAKDIASYETGDSNNKGWYTGLGQTYVYTPDVGQFTLQKPTLNWNRLAGVTAVSGITLPAHVNASLFAGSTTLKNSYSTAGLELSSGTTKVSAKKSWFMFDNEVVALGTDITSAHNNKIETTIDNHYIKDNNKLTIDGENRLWTKDTISTSVSKWALIDGNVPGSNIGIYFPKGAKLGLTRETRTGKWTDLGSYNVDETVQSADYLTMWIDHDAKPQNADYAYVLLPGMETAQVDSYANSADIEILRQDNDVHAVYEKTLNILGVNFWRDAEQSIDAMGVNDYLSVNKAASVMVSEDDNTLSLAISDSTKRTGIITVNINRAATGVVSKDNRVKVLRTSPSIRLEIDVTGSFGNPIEAEFSFKPLAAPGETSIKSITIDDDTLKLEFEPSERATAYKLAYGTESGNYTESLTTVGTAAEIRGLNANTTYYFAVRGVNNSGDGALSEEKSYIIGDTRTLIEEFADFSKTVSYSGGWAFDSSNAATYYEGDATRLKRNDADKNDPKREETVTYYTPSPKSFELTAYDYGSGTAGGETILKIYGSPDNQTWTEIPTTRAGNPTVTNKWSKAVFTNTQALDSSVYFIKIAVSNNTKIYAPQLSKLTIEYARNADRVVMDTMLDDSRAFELTGDVAYDVGNGTKFGGDKDVLVKTGANDAAILYSYTNIKNVKLTAFVAKADGGSVIFESSKDGETFTPVPCTPETDSADFGGYSKVTYSIPALEIGTDYLRLTISGGANSIVLSELSMAYQHEIAPIQQIKFRDAQLEAVMGYDLTPSVKLMPANATGEILYTISNEELVSIHPSTGLLRAQEFGTAVLKAKVIGVDKDVSATVNVRTSENLALGKSATASTTKNGYPVSNVTDGKYLTRWESNAGGAQWLQVDLGAVKNIEVIELNWQQYATAYVVQGSENGAAWTTLYTEANGKGGNVWITLSTVQKYRYIKLSGTAAPANYSLYELRVLSSDPQPSVGIELKNLALGKAVTVNGSDANMDPNAAVDGNLDTRWASVRKVDDSWFTIDLGASAVISEVNLLWEASYGKEYDIEVYTDINDASTKQTVVEERAGAAGWKRYALDTPVTGRYVKMQGIARGNANYGYSIYEFEVLGTMAQAPITSIRFAAKTLTVPVGNKKSTTITTTPMLTNEKSVAYKSSDPTIATVSSSGVITGTAPGTATITAYYVADGNIKDTCEVTVTDYSAPTVPVESISLAGGDSAMKKGEALQLTATVLPENATNKNIRWTSNDASVLLVNSGGLVRAIGRGTATVTAASVANPEIKVTREITVLSDEKAIISFEIDGIRGNINQNDHTIVIELPFGSTETALTPTVVVSPGADYSPKTEQDFTEPVTYTVTAADGSTQEYIVTVTMAEEDRTNIPTFDETTVTLAKDAEVAEFTLNPAPADTDYKLYDAQIGGSEVTNPTVEVTGAKLTLTFTVAPTADATYYISATAAAKTESARVALTVKAYVEPTLERIDITTQPAKLIYVVGDALDITGLVVTGIYSDGSTKEEVITASDVTGFDSTAPAASQELTVTVGDKTATYTVEIKAKPPVFPDDDPKPEKNTKVEITENPDGSITKTVTNRLTGDVVATTTTKDGAQIIVATPKNGTQTIEVKLPEGKDKVTVTIPTAEKPGPGDVVVVVKPDGTKEIVRNSLPTERGIRITLSESAKLEVISNVKRFSDVPTTHWADEVVTFVAAREIFTGTDVDTFSPADNATRAMLVTVLARLDGQDTSAGKTWDEAGMKWAVENKISDGTNPTGNITRQELAAMLYRYAKAAPAGAELAKFADSNQISDWATEAMNWAVAKGILTGKSGNILDPQGFASRAEVAAMLARFMAL